MATDRRAEEILDFWFSSDGEEDGSSSRRSIWFASDPKIDALIATRFRHLVAQAAAGELQSWQGEARGRLALVILLDQFPRNLFRGTPQAFTTDDAALAICERSIDDGLLLSLTPLEQSFLLMPLQHAESRSVQQRSVFEFDKLAQRTNAAERARIDDFARYAHMHKEIIDCFGRFPHRNAILGRADTEAEKVYLAGDAPRFGQR